MNLDEAKENIQPLASGRNIQRLESALNAEFHESGQAELLLERRRYEEAIHSYIGEDPLSPWYEYVLWVEQSYPKSGKQSALDEVVEKCLLTFEQDSRYSQDPRLIKLFIKYLDSQPNPTEHFQTLYNSGIGTMVADLYIFWAYLYDVADNFEKAEYVFQKGRDAKAEPREALEQAHNQFGFSMSQRILHKDKYREGFLSTMEERRNALTSLRTHRGHHVRQQVGSVRVGAAVKSLAPGRVDQHHRPLVGNQASISRERVSVFVDTARGYQPTPQAVAPKSIVQLIMDTSRKQENLREPGPWSKAGAKQSTTMFSQSQASYPSFPILQDMDLDTDEKLELIPMSIREDNYAKPIHLPLGWVSRNEPLTPFPTEFFIAEPIAPNSFPAYDKCMVFPKPDKSFSIEELSAYRWFKKRNLSNEFTNEQDLVWANDPSVGIRLYPQFAATNDPQEEWITERFIPDDTIGQGNVRFAFDIKTIFPPETTEEFTLEDLLFVKFQRGEMAFQQIPPEPEHQPELEETLMACTSMDMMDETMPVQGRQSVARGAIRKSVVPGGRKSIFPMPEKMGGRKSIVPNALSLQTALPKRVEETLPKQSPLLVRKMHPIAEENYVGASTSAFNLVAPPPHSVLPSPTQFAIFEDTVPRMEKETFEPNLPTVSTTPSPFAILEDPCPQKKTIIFEPTALTVSSDDAQTAPSPFVIFKDPEPPKVMNVFKSPIVSPLVISEDPCSQKKSIIFEPTPLTVSSAAPQTAPSPFVIFKDPEPPEVVNVFKSPIAPPEYQPVRSALAPKLIPREPEEQCPPQELEGAVGGTNYNSNETCFSTHQFMFFIKAQSVSTPKAKQRKENIEISSPSSYSSATADPVNARPQSEFVSPPPAAVLVETADSVDTAQAVADISPPQPARQLSTIMETTESTTHVSSSSERESDSTSKTISRPAGFFPHKTIQPVTNLSVVAEHPSISSTSIDMPIASDFPIYRDATTEMPVLKTSGNRVTFNVNPSVLTDRLPPKPTLYTPASSALQQINANPDITIEKALLERSDVVKPNNFSFSIFDPNDDRTEIIPARQLIAPNSICDVSKAAAPSLPVPDMSIASLSLLSFREGNTGQISVIKPNPKVVSQSLGDQKSNRTEETTTKMPSALEHSMATMSFFQDKTTGKLPCLNVGKPFNVTEDKPTQHNRPFLISEPVTLDHPFESTLNQKAASDISIASMSSASLLQEMPSVTSRQHGITFADPNAPVVKEPLSVQKHSNLDDDFLDMFTKTPDKHSKMIAKGNGSSNKKVSSRIPVPSSSCKSAVKSFTGIPLFAEQKSIHIKSEPLDDQLAQSTINHVSFNISSFELMSTSDANTEDHQGAAAPLYSASQFNDNQQASALPNQSIHYKKPLSEFTPKDYESWLELSVVTPNEEADVGYVEPIVDLNETRQVIETHQKMAKVNPFDDDVKAAFLEQCYFVDYMKSLDTCVMVKQLCPIYPKSRLDIGDRTFDVQELIGQGNYGHIFSAKCKTTSKMYAMKQQRPANLWEYYICLEITSRMNDFPNMIDSFMSVNYAVIGNNASILVSPYMKYGSLLDVCNKTRQKTTKNIAEPVVMLLAMQMLSIVDHLHACKIIHADIKPDNILVMGQLSYDHHEICLQLIDFGQAIDMQLYPEEQTFRSKITTQNFVCTEMMNDKPWSYQTDLFCLAATFHTLLFGADMLVSKAPLGYKLNTFIPRYFCREIWNTIFLTLINIKDCRTMPNLQSLRKILLQEVSDKKSATMHAITRFNSILDQK